MIRASALTIARLCGLAPVLAEAHPYSMREGLVGVTFHAICEGDEEKAKTLSARLTTAERAEILGFHKPTDVPDGAIWEQPLAIDINGRAATYIKVEPGKPYEGNAITQGTPDVMWVEDGVAKVGDIKTGARVQFTPSRAPQIIAYGFMWAAKTGAERMEVGIWNAREGEWRWSGEIALDSEEAGDLWGEIVAASAMPAEAVVGPHCGECYSRMYCPARLLPHSQLETELAPMAGGGELTMDTAARGLEIIAGMRDLAKRAEEHLKAFVREHGPIEKNGKLWQGYPTKGKRSGPTLAELEAVGLGDMIKQGNPSERWEWRKKRL